jgi:predicted enzyme related to lactoylglutathione lyase
MIKGMHGLVYGRNVEVMRDFFRDKLKLPYTDVGGGWLIFDVSEGDIGFHPTDEETAEGTHNLSFYTDDLDATVRELESRGVEFTGDIQDRGWGRVIHMLMPAGGEMMLYEPRYQKKAAKARPAKKKKVAARKKAPAKKAAPSKKKPAAKKKKPAAKKKKTSARR